MAYMGRGDFSSFGGNSGGGLENNETNNNMNKDRMYYRNLFFRRYYFIPVDNTYYLIQIIAIIIMFIIAGITFFATYKPSVIDPIENTKRIILNTYIIINLSLLVFIILVNCFSKDKNALIKRLSVLLAISIITILVFLGIKIHLDATYTKSRFEQIYTMENGEQLSNSKSKFDIGLTGVKIKTEKEYYADECLKAYNVFSIKMYGVIGANILLIILLIFQVIKISQIQEKRDRLTRDDAILFDEEENVEDFTNE